MTIIPISRELREKIDAVKGDKSYEEYLTEHLIFKAVKKKVKGD